MQSSALEQANWSFGPHVYVCWHGEGQSDHEYPYVQQIVRLCQGRESVMYVAQRIYWTFGMDVPAALDEIRAAIADARTGFHLHYGRTKCRERRA